MTRQGRMGERMQGILDNAKGKLAILAMTATTLLGGNAVANADNTERANGPDASASAERTLGHNALKKICVKEGLKKPVLVDGELLKSNKRTDIQGWYMNEAVWLLPSECNGEFKRLSWVKTEVRNRGKGWRTSIPWMLAVRTNKGVLGDKNDPNSNRGDYNNKVDAGQLLYVDTDSSKAYKPGGRVRIKMRNRVKDVDSGKFIAGRQWRYKARVRTEG